jgi:putative DNA primase/helicase
VVTGWDAQTCRDAIQHTYNAWLKEFGTGNKEHQQIIEQTEAFLNAYGLSRFAPLGYDPRDLPIRDLAGYRKKGNHDGDPIIFYTFPAAFEQEIAKGFNTKQFAEVLKNAGMLTPPTSGRGYQGRAKEGGFAFMCSTSWMRKAASQKNNLFHMRSFSVVSVVFVVSFCK